MNAANKGEDLYSSRCYNEILVNAKPCGIVIIGLGEKDLNIDYYDAKMLSLEMNLPLYYIDTMKYKINYLMRINTILHFIQLHHIWELK